MIRRFKLYAKIILGRENYIPRQIKQITALYGAPGYGQYYLSKETKEPLIVYSFGIGEEIYFCERLLEKYHDIEIFAFDPTPKAKAFYLSHQVAKDKRFHYFEYGLSDKNEMTTFYLPKNKDYVSGSEVKWDGVDTNDSIRVQMRSLDSLMWQLGHTI